MKVQHSCLSGSIVQDQSRRDVVVGKSWCYLYRLSQDHNMAEDLIVKIDSCVLIQRLHLSKAKCITASQHSCPNSKAHSNVAYKCILHFPDCERSFAT